MQRLLLVRINYFQYTWYLTMAKKVAQKEPVAPADNSEPGSNNNNSESPMETETTMAEIEPVAKAEKGVQTSEVKALCDDLIEVG